MNWDNIFGHSRVKKLLQKSILANQIANAYLFWGIDGIGKDALALQFAKVLNCDSPIIASETIDSCEKCKSCKSANHLQHPNIKYIFSIPAGKSDSKDSSPITKLSDEQINQIREQLSQKSLNPYNKIQLSGNCQIRISAIRNIKKELSLSQTSSGHRCIIISKADEMTEEAANAFLKTLEEPSSNTTIILTTSRKEKLLSTILSRCQQIYLHQLEEIDIIKYLKSYHRLNENEINIISAVAQGSISRATDFLDENMINLKEEIINILRCTLKKRIYKSELIDRISKLIKDKERAKVQNALTILLLWMQDAIHLYYNDESKDLINIDQIEVIKRFLDNFPDCRLDLICYRIEEAINDISRNVNLQLLLTTLFIYSRQILFSSKK